MSEESRSPIERYGPIVVAVAFGGSAVVVGGWYLLSSRGSANSLDSSGFDMASAPTTRRAVAPSAPESAAAPASSLGMIKGAGDLNMTGAPPPAPAAAAPAAADPKEQAAAAMRETALKHENTARAFSAKMEKEYPSLGQYAKDWNSYPDLNGLRVQYFKDHDPVKFAYGVVKSENFGKIVSKYAGDPGVRAFVTQGLKEAPGDMLASLSNVMRNDSVVKDLIGSVSKALGLPPSVTALAGAADPASKVPDSKQVLSEIMSNPATQRALQDQKVPVSAPDQRR